MSLTGGDRTDRSGEVRPKSDKPAYADDPLYRFLSLIRKRAWRAGRKLGENARRRKRRENDPDYRDREHARRYGLSLQEFRAMLERQNYACAICKATDRPLCIDHCRRTGEVRGLLCGPCNLAVGLLGDDPSRARALAAYLEAAPDAAPGNPATGPPGGAPSLARAVAAYLEAARDDAHVNAPVAPHPGDERLADPGTTCSNSSLPADGGSPCLRDR